MRRMRSRAAKLVALLAPLLGVAPSAQAQRPITFAYLRGTDTLGTETVTRRADRMEGSLAMRAAPVIEWSHAEGTNALGPLRMRVIAPNASTTSQEATFTVRGDSLVVEITTNGKANPRQAIQVPMPGIVPLANASVLHAAFIAGFAKRAKLASVPIVLTTGAQSATATVTQDGDVTVFQLGKVAMRIRFAADGLPSEIAIPAQGTRVVRVGASR
ncbi:MAG: hypothetical protein RLZZ621_2199 [Gemmatimonadota bacterium]